MSWLSVLKSILAIFSNITDWLKNRQLIKLADAAAANKALETANETLRKATVARDDVRKHNDSGGLRDDDGFRRD